MKICCIPIDNRPVCYDLIENIAAIDEEIELILPPIELLGDLTKTAESEEIIKWLKNIPECDSIVLSLDTIAYGGLIPSRRSNDSFEEIKTKMENLRDILSEKNSKVYAFSSIMRISNNNINEEEKIYWKDYGKKIFEYSYNTHKYGKADSSMIPDQVLKDYLNTRKRNFEINKLYLRWQNEGFFDTLIFSKDDCAEYGFNVLEAQELETMGGFTKTGADEIPLTLLARSVDKKINICVEYTEPDCVNLVSNYEDVSIEKSVLGQLELANFNIVKDEKNADIILIVNNFREKQGEHVMGWNTQQFVGPFHAPKKLYAVADVRFANGADNSFAKEILHIMDKNFMGYSAWNTSANTLGSLLAEIKIKYEAKKYNDIAFKKSQIIRFLDDWAYQANVRKEIQEPCDIKDKMIPYTKILSDVFDYEVNYSALSFTYPWNRKFEIRISL